jgi:hypothetical protein
MGIFIFLLEKRDIYCKNIYDWKWQVLLEISIIGNDIFLGNTKSRLKQFLL